MYALRLYCHLPQSLHLISFRLATFLPLLLQSWGLFVLLTAHLSCTASVLLSQSTCGSNHIPAGRLPSLFCTPLSPSLGSLSLGSHFVTCISATFCHQFILFLFVLQSTGTRRQNCYLALNKE